MFQNLPAYIANARKAVIQAATLILTIGTLVLTYQSSLPEQWVPIISGAVAIAGSVLHYAVGNAPAPGDDTADESAEVDEDGEADDEVDRRTPPFQPAELVTADQVASSIPPGEEAPAAEEQPNA